jgi:hypothetical protein
MATIPLISSEVAGPLGAIHLPRLWSKVLLSATGNLFDGYAECGMGFDQMVLDGLGVDRDAAVAYIKDNKPGYAQFEKWVVDQRGGSIPQSEIDASNAAIRGYNHGDDTRAEILSGAGISDDGSILDAVNLNNLEDWTELHASVTG